MGMKWEDFENYYSNMNMTLSNYVLTDIECPECGKFLFKRRDIVLTSYPPQYQYECACGFVGYSHNDWENKLD